MSTTASRMLLSSPFPSDAVPVPTGRRARVFVGLFGVAGIAVLVGTIWWMRSDKKPAASEAAVRTAPPVSAPSTTSAVSTTPSSTPAAPPTPVANTSTTPSALSLLVEARRSSWLRTTVDGESDSGRMLAQGETVRLNAKKSVSLRVGDAGAVFVSVNNGQAAPLGSDGQVVTRQFVVESTERQAAAAAGANAATESDESANRTGSEASAFVSRSRRRLETYRLRAHLRAHRLLQRIQYRSCSLSRLRRRGNLLRRQIRRSNRDLLRPPELKRQCRHRLHARPELPTPGPASPASAVVTASRQWLDAYHRQDRATLASLQTEGLQLADERRSEERFPSNVERQPHARSRQRSDCCGYGCADGGHDGTLI